MENFRVFLDTSVFVKHHFVFNKFKLKEIGELAQKGLIELYTTEITKNEIKNRIKDEVQSTRKAINAVFNEGKFLDVYNEFEEIKSWFKKLKKEIDITSIEKFDEFIKTTNTQTIGFADVCPELIFEKYFNTTAPFGAGKKKAEFPDAFAIQALKSWCSKNKIKMYVISNDGDFEKACQEIEELTHIADIPSLLEKYTEHLVNEALKSQAFNIFESVFGNIVDKIIGDIPFVEIQSDLYFENGDEISKVSVESLDVLTKKLTHAGEEYAEFELQVSTTLKATHDMNDPRSAIYSSEFDPWYLDGVIFSQEHDVEVSVTVELYYNQEEVGAPPEIEITIDNGFIEVDTDIDDPSVEILETYSKEE